MPADETTVGRDVSGQWLKQGPSVLGGLQARTLLTCPGDTFSGTPSSTEMLPLSTSRTQSTGVLLDTMFSPQSS